MGAKPPNMLVNPITHSDRARTLIDSNNVARTIAITPEGFIQTSNSGVSGVESIGNSTNMPLSVDGVFTGEWEEITNYAIIKIFIYSDKSGAIGGLLFQQSPDKITIDSEVYEYENNNPKLITLNPVAKWFRIIYINGSEDQGIFSLSTIYSYVYTKPSSHRLGDNVVGNDDAELVKAVMAVRNETDDKYYNVGIQRPLSIEGRSIYAQNIWIENSVVENWTDKDSTGLEIIEIPFTNLHTRIENITSDNPKTILLHFNRTVNAHQIGIGCTGGGNFSNVKISLLGSGHVERSGFDDSANDTKYVSRNYQFCPEIFNSVKIEFHTSDTVTVSNITIQKATPVEAAIKALKPDKTLTFIGATSNGNLKVALQEYGDTPSIDPFDRLRVSNPYTLFDSKQIHDKQPLFWDEIISGSSTSVHSVSNACTKMTVTDSAVDHVIRQTKQRFNYQPGKGQLILMTFLGNKVDGVTKRVGAFDGTGVDYMTPNNGIFFSIGNNISWNIAKNGSTTETVNQENWNVDTLDGSGDEHNESGIQLDLDSTQILIIDYEWLGVGRVRVGFVIAGIIRYVHYFYHSNVGFSSVYMSTPNLPLRYDIKSDGTIGSFFDHICSSVMSEGGIEETGILRSVDTGVTHVDATLSDTTYAIKGIRLKSSYKDVTVIPEFFSMMNQAGDDYRWSLCLNPTISGTFTYLDLLNSAIQEASGVSANVVTNRGLVIDSGYIASLNTGGNADRKFVTTLRMGSTIAGVQDQIVLCVTPLSAGADIHASLTFRELL